MISVSWSCVLLLIASLVGADRNLLQSSSKLTSSCYNFPTVDYGYGNNVKNSYHSSPKVIMTAGKTAIDFTATTDKVGI